MNDGRHHLFSLISLYGRIIGTGKQKEQRREDFDNNKLNKKIYC
jgi:hypothetical protein